ncbi:hypothetical protein CMO89_01990 [Candidatus Woesearchaeota archaeon]|nr:hypothetical protein [Candidatus Woesearchaeota archaeon]
MDKYELFREHLRESAKEFRKIDKNGAVRVVSHLDCDGICACSILIKLLTSENRRYSISIVQQLSEEVLEELSKEDYNTFIFTDLGSAYFNSIKKLFHNKNFFILDHHEIEDKQASPYHINPNLFGIDGGKEISGAGVVYLFCSSLDKNIDMAHIAVIGAIGDVQEENGFQRLNRDILDIAVSGKKIEVKKGLRIFGAQTKPIHKVLEYCSDPYIPGVTGSESGVIQFLDQVGINPKTEKGWRKLIHLTEDEMKKLVTAIILKRSAEKNPEDVLGNVYTLIEEDKECPLRDAKEFSTLLNSCGRLNKASLGIGVCLNEEKSKRKAINNLNEYKKEIVKALKWHTENKDSDCIFKEKGLMIINAKDNIMPSMIGTIASILSRSNNIEEGTYIMSLARTEENTVKVSLRIASMSNIEDVDLRQIITEIIKKVGCGDSGGHPQAAGAIIPSEKEEEFIKIAKNMLRKNIM